MTTDRNITNEKISQLHRAAIELTRGFERMVQADRAEQADSLREASAALIELRRATDILADQLRREDAQSR